MSVKGQNPNHGVQRHQKPSKDLGPGDALTFSRRPQHARTIERNLADCLPLAGDITCHADPSSIATSQCLPQQSRLTDKGKKVSSHHLLASLHSPLLIASSCY